MNILNVCIDAVKTVGTELILIGIRPYYKYEDGKKVDKIEGYRYEIVLCQRKYERLFVKIAGDQRIPFNEDEGDFQSNLKILNFMFIINGKLALTRYPPRLLTYRPTRKDSRKGCLIPFYYLSVKGSITFYVTSSL